MEKDRASLPSYDPDQRRVRLLAAGSAVCPGCGGPPGAKRAHGLDRGRAGGHCFVLCPSRLEKNGGSPGDPGTEPAGPERPGPVHGRRPQPGRGAVPPPADARRHALGELFRLHRRYRGGCVQYGRPALPALDCPGGGTDFHGGRADAAQTAGKAARTAGGNRRYLGGRLRQQRDDPFPDSGSGGSCHAGGGDAGRRRRSYLDQRHPSGLQSAAVCRASLASAGPCFARIAVRSGDA